MLVTKFDSQPFPIDHPGRNLELICRILCFNRGRKEARLFLLVLRELDESGRILSEIAAHVDVEEVVKNRGAESQKEGRGVSFTESEGAIDAAAEALGLDGQLPSALYEEFDSFFDMELARYEGKEYDYVFSSRKSAFAITGMNLPFNAYCSWDSVRDRIGGLV